MRDNLLRSAKLLIQNGAFIVLSRPNLNQQAISCKFQTY